MALFIATLAVDGAALASFPERRSYKYYYPSSSFIDDTQLAALVLGAASYGLAFTGALFLGEAAARSRMRVLLQPVVSSGTVGVTAAGLF